MKIKNLVVIAVIVTLITGCMAWESSVVEDTASVSQSTASVPVMNEPQELYDGGQEDSTI